jgi:Rps23 Pro-64 3,4-dihydroxylase Tpa1-like proline 4-hydroxylase
VLAFLNQGVLNRAEELNREFTSSQPFRHVVIDQVLDAEFCGKLMAEFPAFDTTHALNERGETGRKAVFTDLARLGQAYARFDQTIRSPEFLALLSRITGIPSLLYDPEYVGGGTHENLDGQELDSHVDFNYHPRRQWHRRLNLIVFLNPEWEQDWGGCLELLPDPWTPDGARPATVVVPIANRAVLFETNEHSWHGFRRIQLPGGMQHVSRRSVAVYFYTADRPASETEASHGTLYVHRQLGEQIRAGHTLQQQDADELRTLLARRDVHIKFLYERELEFSKLISGILQSPSFRLGRALTWPARAIRRLKEKK